MSAIALVVFLAIALTFGAWASRRAAKASQTVTEGIAMAHSFPRGDR